MSKNRKLWTLTGPGAVGLAVAVILAASACRTGPARLDDPAGARLEELAKDVYVALQDEDGRFDDSNSVVVVRERDVVVIDAQADSRFVRSVIEAIRAVTDRPVGVVINTHWHADHTQGNALYREAFGESVRILGHTSLERDVPERARLEAAGELPD